MASFSDLAPSRNNSAAPLTLASAREWSHSSTTTLYRLLRSCL